MVKFDDAEWLRAQDDWAGPAVGGLSTRGPLPKTITPALSCGPMRPATESMNRSAASWRSRGMLSE